MVKVGIVNKSNNELPKYATIGSSGMDIRANIGEPIILKPFERRLIPTGIYVDLPEGYEIQVRSRSGLAYKQGLFVLNSPGTIDDDYTGEIGVILCNLSGEEQTINPGDRVAQLVLCKLEDKVEWDEREELGKVTERGAGGYGHTGKQ
ncbi:MAG: dUTP diphosphatase [Bacilli bacterium]|nr:dUTP diphosphatase [Bacilli bacterium]